MSLNKNNKKNTAIKSPGGKKRKRNISSRPKEVFLTDFLELSDYVVEEAVFKEVIHPPVKNSEELTDLIKNDAYSFYSSVKPSENNFGENAKPIVKKKSAVAEKKDQWQLSSPHLLDLKGVQIKSEEISVSEKKWSAKESKIYFEIKKAFLKSENFGVSSVIFLKKFKFQFPKYHFNYRFKFALSFFLIGLILLAPLSGFSFLTKINLLKDSVAIQSAKALTNLANAAKSTQNKNYSLASDDFNQAALNFSDARISLESYNDFFWQLASHLPITGKKINSVKDLLTAGEKISLAAGEVTNLINQTNDSQPSLITKLNKLNNNLKEIDNQLNSVSLAMNDLDERFIPQNYQKQYYYFKQQLPLLQSNLKTIQASLEAIYQILAPNGKKNYLIFFQNSNELRATGGFLGSFALISVDQGEIKKLEIPGGGPYDLQSGFTKQIISPEPMHLINSRWQIWDANWWPDFPSSAEKIMWFYEASGGLTPDGVITINSNILPDLLKITGDLYLDKYGKLITSANVIDTIQFAVEHDYDKSTNQPKQIIADLAPLLIDKLVKTDQNKSPLLAATLINSLKQKDIQVYLTDPDLEKMMVDLDFGGKLKEAPGDYLFVVSQNIGGGKTDGVVEQTIDLQTQIAADGSIINTVAVTRKHNGQINNLFTKFDNVSYLRIYAPLGSELISANGYDVPTFPAKEQDIGVDYEKDNFYQTITGPISVDEKTGTKINNEFGKTVFGQWLQLKPGETKTLILKYKLPFKTGQKTLSNNLVSRFINFIKPNRESSDNYSLLVQKQSGVISQFKNRLNLPEDNKIIWKEGDDQIKISDDHNNLSADLPLKTDQFYTVILSVPKE